MRKDSLEKRFIREKFRKKNKNKNISCVETRKLVLIPNDVYKD